MCDTIWNHRHNLKTNKFIRAYKLDCSFQKHKISRAILYSLLLHKFTLSEFARYASEVYKSPIEHFERMFQKAIIFFPHLLSGVAMSIIKLFNRSQRREIFSKPIQWLWNLNHHFRSTYVTKESKSHWPSCFYQILTSNKYCTY